ncbi:neurofilament light polypeptide-like [Takifugu flavidus]|uniref:Uncharacterized protein n=1 Tax=Takifugu flavidus TaxID=433684 RepID=A0A5C6N7C2_9TELE|nr:neurofilament light polypeptide-like [Takifugu flavidus]TWW63404.1 hypothetical protein D4764_03G0004120 [Takifugu flavidus]
MKVHILLLMFGFVTMFESASGFGLLHKGIEAAGETLKNLQNNAHNIVKALLHDLGVPDEEVEGVSDEIEDVKKDLEEEEEESVAESTGETEEEVEEEAEPEAKEADVSVAGANEAVEDATHEEDE